KIVVFAGSYHGMSDGVLARGRTARGVRETIPVSIGIPSRVVEDVVVLGYGAS
ncbi:MAG: aspartate aminotransferase family protein, partial [Gammaproteobacteria bacterium]|nr:aspartate aminotransferase family protein [Gammaproteobacteria bacterium]